MKTRFLIYGLLLIFSSSVFASTSNVAQLAKLLNNYKSYQANFSQTTIGEHHRVVQKSTGLFYLQRPDKFSWQQKTPTEQNIVSDGQFLWVYDIDLMQVTKQPLSHSSLNPAQLLAGDFAKVAGQFNIERVYAHADSLVFKLTPKKQDNNFKSVSLHFWQGKLAELQLVNNLSQTTNFKFTNVKINGALSAKIFQFTPPEGVEVLAS